MLRQRGDAAGRGWGRASAALAVTTWVVIGVGLLIAPLATAPSGEAQQAVLLVAMAVFFASLLVQLGVGIVRAAASERPAMVTLGLAVVFWIAGSTALNAGGAPHLTEFPAPGEWLFLVAYVGFAAFLLLDGRRTVTRSLATVLDTVVVTGGAASLVGIVVLTPVAVAFGGSSVPLLVALIYPLADLVLALVVVAQVGLRLRGQSPRSALLLAGFLLFAVADSTFVVNLPGGTYSFPVLLDLLWAAALALVVLAACLPRRPASSRPGRWDSSSALLLAAAAALVVLVAPHPPGLGWYLNVPALLTLVAAGGRLLLALREARDAAEAYRLSRTDDLTGLPNRRALLDLIDEADPHQPMAFVLVDIDGFKEVNDTFGHDTGDEVLHLVALRLRSHLPASVPLARLGGDEFAAVLPTRDTLDLLEAVSRLRDVVRTPLQVEGLEIVLQSSAGIAVRDPEDSGSALLRRADVAMYQAKLSRVGATVYDASRDEFSRQRLVFVDELRRALADGQLTVWYQPQISAATQTVTGLEALVRWDHPVDGMRSPAVFLPTARRAGLMPALTEEVQRHVVRDAARWWGAGLRVRVSMNLAPPELLSSSVVAALLRRVDAIGLPAGALGLEVTEDSFLADPERARAVLAELARHGLEVSVDDYGTGFSSLSYLRDLHAQELKIDRSFIATLIADERSRLIVRSTTQMAHALGMRVVAEGVEDAATSAEVVAMGVDAIQGYHVAPPMPAGVVEAWLRDWSASSATASLSSDEQD